MTSFSWEAPEGREVRGPGGWQSPAWTIGPHVTEDVCFVAFNFFERFPVWDFPCLARSASCLSGKSWEALGPRRPRLPRQLSIVTKIALLREGRYFLWLRFPSQPDWPSEKKRQEPTAHRIGIRLVRGLYGDSTVTKGGNEYAVLVITLYTSQFVFQYVISIIKLPKRVTNDTDSCQGVGGGWTGAGSEAFFLPNSKIAFSEKLMAADWLLTRRTYPRRWSCNLRLLW